MNQIKKTETSRCIIRLIAICYNGKHAVPIYIKLFNCIASVLMAGYVYIQLYLSKKSTAEKKQQLEVRGRARREAARRRKSECKVNLRSRNSPRSNGSWQMSPKSTKYSAAAIGRRSDQ